jgi:hypothetical protein
MLRDISNPKYCRGTISEKIRTRNPADMEITLIIIAFPLTAMVSSSAFDKVAPSFR